VNVAQASWSRFADAPKTALAAAVAAALFFVSWGVLHYGFYQRGQIPDTPVYERYGDLMAGGLVPYRDFGVEYPPGALPAFVVPSLLADQGDFDGYRRVFEALMAACGAAAAAFVAVALVRVEAGAARLAGGIALAAFAPLLLGSVMLSRFDLWPAAVTAAALAAAVSGRLRLAFAVLGLAIAVKVYPTVLLPLFVAYAWKQRGRREALVGLGRCAAVVAACFLPFLVLGPHGVWWSVVRQTTRPLQIESLGSGFLLTAHQVFGTGLTMESSHGSQNLAGSAPDALGAVQAALQLTVLLFVWWRFARGNGGRERLLAASASAVVAFVALGKVLSPQYMIWLAPLVALVGGRRGAAAGALLVAAMVLTQLWFPYHYWSLALSFAARPSWLVLARDLVLVALLGVLAWPSPPAASGECPRTRP
jgi:Glycosyltransferase family 87